MSAAIARVLALVMVAALFSAAGCEKKDTGFKAPPPPAVTVQTPEQRRVEVFTEYTGSTQGYSSVDVRARVEGYLDKINFSPSSRVKAGDLLFVIEQAPFQAKVDQAKADLATAQAQLQLADATLIRKESAFKDRAVSEVDVIQARAEKAQAEASVKAADAALESAKINFDYTVIHAPTEGRVSRNLVDRGNLVGAGEATLLTTVVDDDPLYAYFNIAESDLLEYLTHKAENQKKGLQNEIKDPPKVYMGSGNTGEFPFVGRIDYIDNTVDPGTGTIQLRGVFPNPDGALLPGMFVRVRIPVGVLEKALLVPEVAVASDQGGRYLLVVDANDVVQYRKIELGPPEGDQRVILKGIEANDRVIVNGLQKARPGSKVTPQVAGAQGAAAGAAKTAPAKSKEKPASTGDDKKKPQTNGG